VQGFATHSIQETAERDGGEPEGGSGQLMRDRGVRSCHAGKASSMWYFGHSERKAQPVRAGQGAPRLGQGTDRPAKA
jgi:hypothetical protein